MTETARRFGEALLYGGAQHSWSPEALGLASSVPRYRRVWRVPSWVRQAPRLAGVGVMGAVAVAGPFVAYAYHVELPYVVGLGALLAGYAGLTVGLRARERRAALRRRLMEVAGEGKRRDGYRGA